MRKLKLFFACMLMSLLSIGQMWAVTITPGGTGWTTTGESQSATVEGVTLATTKGMDSGTGGQIRIYKDQTFTISSSSAITSITFTCTESGTTKYGPGCFGALDGYTYSGTNGSWTGSATSVTFTASSNQVRILTLEVTLASGGTDPGDEPGGDEPGGDEPSEDPEPTVTFNYSDYKGEGITSTGSPYTMEKTQVSIGDTKFFGNNSYAHFYAGGVTTITPAAGVTITKMVLTASAENYNGYQSSGTVTASAGSLSHEGAVVTWTGSTDEAFTISHNKQIRWTTIVVTYEEGEAPAVAKPTINGDTYFYASSEVSMTCATDGAEIRYTLDGTDPTATSILYENPFTLTATTTVKAIAVKGTDVSAIAEKEFTKATVKTVAEALAMSATEDVYVTGYISAITEVSVEHKNATYRISDDGTTTGEMIVYRGKYLNNADYTEENKNNIHVGDKVVVRGGLVEYQNAMQLATGNYLISIEYPEVAIPTFEPAVESFLESVEVSLACSTDGAEIRYTLDGTDPTATSTLYEDPFTLTETKTVKAIAIKGGTTTNVVSKTYTKQEVMTVAEALASSAATGVYVKGIISTITEVSTSFNNATYRISDNGTKTDEMIVYRGRYINNTDFTSEGQIELEDEVVVYGNLVEYQNAMQLTTGNYLISLVRKASAGLAWSAESVELTVGDEFTAPTLSNPNNLTVTIASDNTELATVENGVVSLVADATGTAKISATFAGNDQYKAASVTYSITVNASETPVDTRKVANSPATFTSTSGDLNPADIAFAAYKGGAGTAPGNYNNGIRLYQAPSGSAIGGYITLTAVAGCTIDEVQITATGTYATTVTYSVDGNETLLKSESVAKSGSYTTGTGLNVQSVNIVNKGTTSSGRLEIASIKVYYTGEAATIDHYELGGTYTTEFETGDEFNHDGLIVYAAYDAQGDDKEDITASCTFSEPDMSVAGEKTIEITYKEAVVKSYTINVTEATPDTRKVANGPATFTTIKGDLTPSDIAFEAFKGGSSTNPANYNDGIRLYQIGGSNAFGGYLALTAVKGCAIDQVAITTTSKYATTVAYSIDGNENLLGEEAVAKSGEYTTPAGLNAKNVNILNLGTGSEGRLEIASIKVWYTGDAIAIDHYELGGTYATEFGQYDEFNHEGLIVYAAYDAQGDDKEDITAACTFSEPDMSEAGEKTIEITYKEAVVKSYTITVNASAKEDPAFEYSPASATITAGDEWNAPTLNKAFEVSPISFVSDKPAVATVDENGVITLAGGYGTAVITASFEGDDDYLASEATYTITVNKPAPTPTSTIYRKVTATADITDGEYLIVYEGDATHDAAVFDGSLDNDNIDVAKKVLAVEIENDEIAGNTELDAAVFTIDVTAGSLQSASGLYIGKTDFSNGMDKSATEAYVNTFAITDGAAVITGVGGCTLRYNYAVDQLRFRYYKSGQQAIQLYKKETVTPPTPVYTEVRSGLEAGRHYTVCLENNVTAVKGATFWSLTYRNEGGTAAYLVEETAPFAAGKPYIFQATGDNDGKLEVVYGEESATDPVENGALRGTFEDMTASDLNALTEAGQSIYMLFNNELRPINTNNHLDAHRAYVRYDLLTVPSTSNFAPGKRVKSMPMQGQTTTGIDALNASETPVKMIIDGQLFIIRGEKMYNVNGQLVK